MAKRKWSDMSRTQQVAITVVGLIEVAATAAMLVDLQRRPASTVHGSKPMWRGLAVVQPLGPLAYFTFGRRHP